MTRRLLAAAALLVSLAPSVRAQTPFQVDETTIADVHAAMRAGTLTCHALVQAYLRRIDAYDKTGPGDQRDHRRQSATRSRPPTRSTDDSRRRASSSVRSTAFR